ncbi:MAG: glycosyltransferase family 4 protein [Bryobacteraceae bacterium]|nr:glycosyltransferase family 4 protein [Bryobacteraceae bacterium]
MKPSGGGPQSQSTRPPTLLCVSNYPSNTGYAWDFIERIYAGVADRLAARGIPTLVAYPKLSGAPRSLAGSTAVPVEFVFRFHTPREALDSLRFIRANNIGAVYLTDRAACSLFYPILRLAGVRSIVVHDHTSGEQPLPHPLFLKVKRVIVRLPGLAADTVVVVSDYVAGCLTRAASAPPWRIRRIWNGVSVSRQPFASGFLRKLINVAGNRPLIVCCCRADAVKGIAYLLRSFDAVVESLPEATMTPVLVYIGDGPQRKELEEIRDGLSSRDEIFFLGYRADAASLLDEADICVVPSVWQDAFPLGVLESMAAGKPVIATSVGGIPEMIDDGVTGLLVPPADEQALADAISCLLGNPDLSARLASAGRQRVAERFSPEQQLDTLTELVGSKFPR